MSQSCSYSEQKLMFYLFMKNVVKKKKYHTESCLCFDFFLYIIAFNKLDESLFETEHTYTSFSMKTEVK